MDPEISDIPDSANLYAPPKALVGDPNAPVKPVSLTVEVPVNDIRWADCCCRCGSKDFKWRRLSERVVVWTLITVTKYRTLSLTVPVCDSCNRQRFYWFAGAAALGGGAYAMGAWGVAERYRYGNGGLYVGIALLVAIALVIIGLRQKPVRLLRFTPEVNLLAMRIRNLETARSLLEPPEARAFKYESISRPYRWMLYFIIAAVIVSFALKFVR